MIKSVFLSSGHKNIIDDEYIAYDVSSITSCSHNKGDKKLIFEEVKKLDLRVRKSDEDLWVIANFRNNYAYLGQRILGCLIQNKTLAKKGLVPMYEYYTQRLNT